MFILSQIKNMFRRKPKIIVVLGQTSTGKSDIAVEIAKKYNGEVISADSRQVYRGMDLGSGKITTEEMSGVPHHLLDVAEPKDIFDVQQYRKLGTESVMDILSRGKVPIICGGTGFYIDSLINQTQFSSVGPNKELRSELEKKSLKELQDLLQKKSAKDYKKIDTKNPVRIIRALEILDTLGKIPKVKKNNPYNVLYIGLKIEKDLLHKRIHARILKRLELGMLDEAHQLLASGVSHQRLQSLGLEYKYMSLNILRKINYDEMIEKLYWDTVHFAKRQKTWFKRNKEILWFDSIKDTQEIFNTVSNFLGK